MIRAKNNPFILLLGQSRDEHLLFKKVQEERNHISFELEVANTVDQAREIFNTTRPDICFVNHHLGSMSGSDFIQKNAIIHPDTAFVLLLDEPNKELDAWALQSGAHDVIRKPDLDVSLVHRSIRYVSQRLKHQEYLRGQRRAMGQILNSIGEIFWIYDHALNKFTEVDREIARLLGVSHDECMQHPEIWMEHIHEQDRGPRQSFFQGHLQDNVQHAHTYRLETAQDGTRTMLERVIRRSGPAGEDWLIGVTRDMTEQKKNESQLQLLERVVQQTGEAILVTDGDLEAEGGPKIVYANEAFSKMTGYKLKELIGQSPKLLQGPETDLEVLDRLRSCLKHEEEFKGETINYRKDGSTYWVRWSITPLYDEEGHLEYFASIQQNIDKERENNEMEARNQRLRSLGNLVGGVAHDLNNILAPIMMTAGLMEQEDQNENTKQYAETLTDSTKRASQIVSKLLIFARGGKLEHELADIRDVINEVYAIGKETFPKNIQLECNQADDIWPVKCSPTEIQQVVLNLAINAKDSMQQEEGTLGFTTQNQVLGANESRYLIGAAGPGPHVRIDVADTGHGIPESDLDTIFDPFHTTKKSGEGTGLGLASALGIVRSHKGGIRVESEVGKGTTFQVFLPASPDRAIEKKAEQATIPKGDGQRLLIVDDEKLIVETVCSMLESQNYRTEGLTSSQKALEVFQARPDAFQGIITDLMMPELNGCDLIEKIRDVQPDLPVLVMSGYAHHELLSETKKMDRVHFVQKPVRGDDLLNAVKEIFAPAS